MDHQFIYKKALEKGLIRLEETEEFNKDDSLKLIFLPGFSTKTLATEFSRRGVGMDVVKNNVHKLGGLIEINSDLGKGLSLKSKSLKRSRLNLQKVEVFTSIVSGIVRKISKYEGLTMGGVSKKRRVKILLTVRAKPQLSKEGGIAWGKGTDHAGKVYVKPLKQFNLNKTIFSTLEGKLARLLVQSKIAKAVYWDEKASVSIEKDFQDVMGKAQIPPIKPELIEFLHRECDFSSEHADGSFLEHLVFCYEYSAVYFPEQPPLVMLLHSILGTGQTLGNG